MKKIINILNITFILLFFNLGHAEKTISMFNFNNSNFDENDSHVNNISKQISSDFIDLMKGDMAFIEQTNFISTEELDKELISVRKSLLKEVKEKLNSGIIDAIKRNDLSDIVSKVSGNNLNEVQLEALTDSLLILVSTSTKEVTRDMLLSNSSNEGQWGEITVDDLYAFIENITHRSIWKSTFSSMIASSRNDFNTDIFINSTYKIEDNNVTVNFFLYNLEDLHMFSKISAESSIENLNVLIKELEFKVLTELGILLEDSQRAELCMYDVEQFSKKNQSLYLSNLFMTEDIKQMKYKMQFSDDYDLISQYYISFITGLMENKISYDIKFYNDDNFYNVYSTESSNDSTFFVNVLKDGWSNKIGLAQNLHGVDQQKKSKMLIEIDYRYVQAIQFKNDQESFINMLKQISIYSFIVTSGFLLVQFF